MRTSSSSAVLVAMLLTGVTAASAQPGDFGGTYAGEVVIRSLSSNRVVIALDEHGFGFADRLFFADTAQPVGFLSARSSVAKVGYTAGELVVTVPSEQRVFVFQVPGRRSVGLQRRELGRGGEGDTPAEINEARGESIGFETVRIDQVVQLAAYAGMREHVRLADVEQGRLAGLGPRSLGAAEIVAQNPTPPPDPDNGSGCRTSCSVSCGGGSTCSITCTNGHCGSCDCISGHGASCSCN